MEAFAVCGSQVFFLRRGGGEGLCQLVISEGDGMWIVWFGGLRREELGCRGIGLQVVLRGRRSIGGYRGYMSCVQEKKISDEGLDERVYYCLSIPSRGNKRDK